MPYPLALVNPTEMATTKAGSPMEMKQEEIGHLITCAALLPLSVPHFSQLFQHHLFQPGSVAETKLRTLRTENKNFNYFCYLNKFHEL